VEGRSDTTYAQRIALDVSYAETWSVRGDLAILLKTVPAVLRGRGAQ
jgi:exopolysaccharide production protein ExoY